MDAKALHENLESLGLTLSLTKPEIGKEVRTSCLMEAFQFGDIGSA